MGAPFSFCRGFAGLAALSLSAVCLVSARAQEAVGGEPVVPAEFNGDLRSLPRVLTRAPGVPFRVPNEPEPPRRSRSNHSVRPSPNVAFAPSPKPNRSFVGLTNDDGDGSFPSDANGDVGPNHYVQGANTSYAVYSKSGTRITLFTENSLWKNVGTTPCNGNAQGDPVVLYDRQADRWILTHFAFATDSLNNDVAPFYECIAVSKTPDPVSGGWWLYSFQMDPGGSRQPPASTLADYPKFGVWSDGCLYMGANEYREPDGTFAGTIAVSFNRLEMEAGQVAHFAIVYNSATADPFTLVPANVLGGPSSLPPPGTPAYFVSQSQNTFAWEVRKFTPAANCGAGGILSASVSVSEKTYTTPGETIVPQPGTKAKLDSLGDRIMQKVQYRRIGAAESLWAVHSVQTSSGSVVLPHWVQINVTGGNISTTPVQEQIYAPDTSLYRWMPSIAVDQAGNMAIGYSTSNAAVPNYPSIAWSGRLAGDPPGTLPQTETQLVAGVAPQTFTIAGKVTMRWGDYSSMSIDPTDDCTFWYTNMYYASAFDALNGNWSTRIGSFQFPTCGASAAPPAGVSPATGSGAGGTFSFTFANTTGFANFSVLDVLINNALDGRRACYIAFQPSSANGGSLFLVDDAGDAGGPYQGLVLPGGGSVSNSQCTISAAGSSVSGIGNTYTLTLAISFAPAFSGNHVVFLSAQDKVSGNAGWHPQGAWNVPGGLIAGPAVTGVNPSGSTAASETLAFTFADSNGRADLSVVNVLINSAIDGRHACFLAFAPSAAGTGGSLFLVDDAGDAGGPYQGLVIPGSGSVSNSQCSISASGASVTPTANGFTLSLPMVFNHSFAGTQVLYLAARSTNATSDWQASGIVTVP